MLSDLRFALRQFGKAPGFTATIVVTLALGIGACTAVFSVINATLFYTYHPDPDRHLIVHQTRLPQQPEMRVSAADYLDWKRESKSFESLCAFTPGGAVTLTGEAEAQWLTSTRVTAQFFEFSSVRFALGRGFLPAEEEPGNDRVVILSYPIWQNVFGGAKDIIGRMIQLKGVPHAVVGVTPEDYKLTTNDTNISLPLAFSPSERANRATRNLWVRGVLKSGVSLASAQAEFDLISARLAREHPDTNQGVGAWLLPFHTNFARPVRPVLWVLFGAVACVLLIACANVANLLLARAASRQREVVVRSALGASRGRIIRLLLTESLLVAVLGGAVGLLLAEWALAAVRLYPRMAGLGNMRFVQLDYRMAAFALGLSVLSALIFGLAPAWLASRIDLNQTLKQGSRGSTEGAGQRRIRHGLVVAEVAVTLALLAVAGLFMRSFASITKVDPGIQAANAIVVRTVPPAGKYATHDQRVEFARTILERFRALPGVTAAELSTNPGFYYFLLTPTLPFAIEGQTPDERVNWPQTTYASITPGYIQAAGVRLVRGRGFTGQDDTRAPRVALINETLARQHFPNADPIGKRIRMAFGANAEPWAEIVGIVGDVTQAKPDVPITAQIYQPHAQRSIGPLHFLVKASGDVRSFAALLKQQLQSVDRDHPITDIRTLEDVLAERMGPRRFELHLFTLFALIAFIIGAIGIYGVIAYSVSQRTAEIGIRMALGAMPADVARLVLEQGGRLVVIGLVIGTVLTLAVGRFIESRMFQISTRDPFTLVTIALLLGVVGMLACWLPARRATKVDPIVALRAE